MFNRVSMRSAFNVCIRSHVSVGAELTPGWLQQKGPHMRSEARALTQARALAEAAAVGGGEEAPPAERDRQGYRGGERTAIKTPPEALGRAAQSPRVISQ